MYREDFGGGTLVVGDRFIDYDGARFPSDELREVRRGKTKLTGCALPSVAGVAGVLTAAALWKTGRLDLLIYPTLLTPLVMYVLWFVPTKTLHTIDIVLRGETLTFHAARESQLDPLYNALLRARGIED